MGLTERGFVAEQRKHVRQAVIVAALTTASPRPRPWSTAEADFDARRRAIDYFVLPAAAAGEIAAPTDEALKAFFNDRKSSYRAPEYRAIDVVALDARDARQAGRSQRRGRQGRLRKGRGKDPRFGAPEKRKLQQIVFPNEGEADAAAAKIKAGASFDDIVKERNLKPDDTDLGETTKAGMFDKAEADAVFALPQGGVSDVIKGQFGPAIVRVKSITPATVKPYDEVADEVKRQISASRAGDKIQALHDKIEDLARLGQVARRRRQGGRPDRRAIPAVDAQGHDPKGAPRRPAGQGRALRAVFASDVGVDEAPLDTKDRGFVWFDVTKIDPAHDRTFDEAKDEVEKQWRDRGGRQGAGRQGGRYGQADQRGRERRRPREERGRGGEDGAGHPSAPSRRACRKPWSPRYSASPPTAPARRRRRTGGCVFKITADATPPVDFADPRVKAMAAKLDGATRESLLDQYVAALAAGARRRRARGGPAVGRGRLIVDDRLPDYDAFARAYRRGRAEVAVTTLVADLETPVSAYLKLAPAAPATCSCSNRSRAARSAAAIR